MSIFPYLTNADIEHIILIIRNQIPCVQGIYLFGSYADGEPTALSDIDIAFLPEMPQEIERTFELSLELSSQLKKDIDCIDLKTANTVLVMQIISTGKLIYFLDKSQVDFFEITIFSMYAILNEERKEIIADVLQRGSVYGK